MLNLRVGLNYIIVRNVYILVIFRFCFVNNGINSSLVFLFLEFYKVIIK